MPITALKRKAAPWVKEDIPNVLGQLAWLKSVHEAKPNVTLLLTHDNALFTRLVGEELIGAGLAV